MGSADEWPAVCPTTDGGVVLCGGMAKAKRNVLYCEIFR